MTKQEGKIIAKINRETKDDLIGWTVTTGKPSSLSASEILINTIYICNIKDKNLRLYKYRSKHFYDEDAFEWVDSCRFEFIDQSGNSEWAFSEDRGIIDLYDTVRFKTAGIDQFFEDYLIEEEAGHQEEDF